jgi:hypothetical protein
MNGNRPMIQRVEVLPVKGGCPNGLTLRVEGNGAERVYCISPLNPRTDCGPAVLDGSQIFTKTHCRGCEYTSCFYNKSKAAGEEQK